MPPLFYTDVDPEISSITISPPVINGATSIFVEERLAFDKVGTKRKQATKPFEVKLSRRASPTTPSSLSTTMENLKESVRRAVEGHEELGTWNSRAEEVIRILDKIKVDREGGGGGMDDPGGKKVAAARGNGGKGAVAPREDDEQRRKRTMEEIGIGSHGTKEEVESFLKKIRG